MYSRRIYSAFEKDVNGLHLMECLTIRLTLHTDYALRILLHAAAMSGTRLSIADIAQSHGISRNHVMKVVNHLSALGHLRTTRGRGGGFELGRDPAAINIGQVVRQTEPNLQPADCANCVLNPGCGFTPLLGSAVSAFLGVLDATTLADVLARNRSGLATRLSSIANGDPAKPT